MLSAKTHDNIKDVSREALRQIGDPAIVDKVSVIQRFQKILLAGEANPKDYEAKIADGLRGLLYMVEEQGKHALAMSLRILIATIGMERLRRPKDTGEPDHIDPERLLFGKTQVLRPTRDELRHMFHCDLCCTAFYEISETSKWGGRPLRGPRNWNVNQPKSKSERDSGK